MSKYTTLAKLGQQKESYKIEKEEQEYFDNQPIPEIQTLEEKNQLIRSKKVCIVDVYASWCGPCQITAPLFQKLAMKYKDHFCTFAKENVELRLSPNVTVIPTFQFYLNGNFHSIITGADMNMIENKIIELTNF